MMQRYELMEKHGVQDYVDLPPLPEGDRQRLLTMVDEAAELLSPTGVKTDEGKADDLLKGEALYTYWFYCASWSCGWCASYFSYATS